MSVRLRYTAPFSLILAFGSAAHAQTPAAEPVPSAADSQGPSGEPVETEGGASGPAAGESAEPSAEQKELARRGFRQGNELYDGGRFDEALTAYQRSYSAVASPNTRLMIGRTLERLGRLGQAYDELIATERDAMERGGKYIKAGEAARQAADAIRPLVGLLTIAVLDAPEGTLVNAQDRDVPASASGTTVAVMPGEVTVVAMGDGRTVSTKANVVAGEDSSVELVMTPEPAAPAAEPLEQPQTMSMDTSDAGSVPLRTWGYVAGGVGAAGLITFGVFGTLSQSKYDDLEENCVGGTCPSELEDDIDSGRTYQTIANIGLVVGAVGLATGVTLFVIGGEDDAETQTAGRTTVRISPGSVQVGGTF